MRLSLRLRLRLRLDLRLALTVSPTQRAPQVTQLGGFWVKLAQGASVVSALPDAYAAELCQLQDAMPADPIHDVHATLRAELGAEWRQLVTHIEPEPIGSATIAQVHRATLRLPRVNGGGEIDEVEAVLKVQHPRIAKQLAIDIHASTLLAVLLGAVAPHLFRDLRPVVKELAEITRGELDFAQEACNQTLAARTLGGSGLRVRVPTVFPQLVTRRLLAMEFVDGVKLTQMRAAEADGGGGFGEAEASRVVETLVRYYGVTMHGEIFNCDPHPGNLLVDKASGDLVVLDWGQARRLSATERAAHARLFLSIMMEDVNLLGDACAAPARDRQVKGSLDPHLTLS
jgi:predicted unusual protein kinase regulating ubiquinone biosynthesis (AarF/ABC1/UbiB family)